MRLHILAVCVGEPAVLQIGDGEPVMSAIRKTPLESSHIELTRTNIEGDRQADPSVHGGPDKAVYAYPAGHAQWWEARGVSYRPGYMGENLSLDGATEDDVRIGDRFAWGEAVLEISEPRGPCFKLGILTGREDAPQHMTLSGHCGWYMRVLKPALAPVRGTLDRIETDPAAPTVRETFLIRHRPASDPALLARAIAHPALAQSWRDSLLKAQSRLSKV